ncbi:MAG: UV DNA damage repair endonuclease UvsE [Clostridiaceae bacterium]
MKIRFGYVSIALKLGEKSTTSSSVTFANYQKQIGEEKKLNKLKVATRSNLDNLKKIFLYNIENQIHFYRITSALIPLATHPEVGDWGYRKIFKKDFEDIGKLIKISNLRVDTHPDQFNVINSVNEKVVENTITNLIEHVHLFEDLNYDVGKMVLHLGGATGGKEVGIQRFIDNFKKYPTEITSKIILENDDKTFNVKEILYVCETLKIPMVVDIHHHLCNNEGEEILNYLPRIFDTWNNEKLPPKIHFSSPKETERDRKHADYIDIDSFLEFIDEAKHVDRDFDVMIEAKQKDLALYKLVEDIKLRRPEIMWIDNSTFQV